MSTFATNFYYRFHVWKWKQKYEKRKNLILWRIARVRCALTEHDWIHGPRPKFNSPEWRDQFPRGLVEYQCRRCLEIKFDRVPGYRGK